MSEQKECQKKQNSQGEQINLSSRLQQSAIIDQVATSKYINLIRSSLINKSCIQSCSFANGMHRVVPKVSNPQSVQRIDISCNYIKYLNISNMPNLKQLIANKNKIENLPEQLNQLPHLRIIKVNDNHISIIPFLKSIQHIQINKNPIKLITSQIRIMNAHCIMLDWMDYLIPQASYLNRQDVYKKFKTLIDKIDFDKQNNRHFLRFSQIFEVSTIQKSTSAMSSLLYKAIMQKASFFIEHMKFQLHKMEQKSNKVLNINQLMFLGKPLLEYALQNSNSEAVQLFMLRRRNLNDTDSFFLNLELACRYSHSELFEFLMGGSGKKILIMGKEMHLISQLLVGFTQSKKSQSILRRILQFHQRHNKGHKIKIRLPIKYNSNDIQCISNGLLCILKNVQLKSHFSLDQTGDEKQQQPILHFACLSKCPELINFLIQQGLNPFVRNICGIPPRMICGSLIGRKLFWGCEKKKIKQRMLEIKQQQPQNVKQQIPKNFSSAFKSRELVDQPFNIRMYKSLSAKDYLNRNNARPNFTQIFTLNIKNIPKCLEFISKASLRYQIPRLPKKQNYISLQPKSEKISKLKVQAPKRLSFNYPDEKDKEKYQNMIHTLNNLTDQYSDIISENMITRMSKLRIPRQKKIEDCQSLISKQGNALKNYELFQSICNQNIIKQYNVQLEQKSKGFQFYQLRLCEQVGNADQYDDAIRKKRIRQTCNKKKLQLTAV